ncbi:ATP-binding protein [Nocardia harenae]|uniref:ATP-binding protein n=1 Tax=Nocardia harenae TaxID=358707 RepID=UPI00082FFCDD|nr:ATP-binding protein [Nocardia harenae]
MERISGGKVFWRPEAAGECAVLRPRGVLDAATSRRFGADLVRFAMEQPRALIVSLDELVENAVRHGAGDVGVRLELRAGGLTVAVSDADPHPAVLREPAAGEVRAYGLHVVAHLARAWGCAPCWPSGKVVWATLPV